MTSAPTRLVMASSPGQVSTQLKSPPAEKARPSLPTTSTRTASSAANASTASTMARAVSPSKEFIWSAPVQREPRHAACHRGLHRGNDHAHIRKTPNFVGPIGWFIAADRPSASAMRVSTGSRMPSSHSRAVA